jgi:hypothetical protein
MLTTHLHLLPKLRMNGAIPLLSPMLCFTILKYFLREKRSIWKRHFLPGVKKVVSWFRDLMTFNVSPTGHSIRVKKIFSVTPNTGQHLHVSYVTSNQIHIVSSSRMWQGRRSGGVRCRHVFIYFHKSKSKGVRSRDRCLLTEYRFGVRE